MIKSLVKLANHLDKIGHGDLSDSIDGILKSAETGGLLGEKEEGDLPVFKDSDQRAAAPAYVTVSTVQQHQGSPFASGDLPKKEEESVDAYIARLEGEEKKRVANEIKDIDSEAEFKTYMATEMAAAQNLYWGKPDMSDKLSDLHRFMQSMRLNVGISKSIQGFPGSEAVADSPPTSDITSQNTKIEDRIKKMADMMSGEFNQKVLGPFYR